MPAGALMAARQVLGSYLAYARPWQRAVIGAAVTGGAAALIAAGAVTGHVTMIVVGSLLLLATGNACVQVLRARRRTGSAGEAATPPP
jgi:hypothetical protein